MYFFTPDCDKMTVVEYWTVHWTICCCLTFLLCALFYTMICFISFTMSIMKIAGFELICQTDFSSCAILLGCWLCDKFVKFFLFTIYIQICSLAACYTPWVIFKSNSWRVFPSSFASFFHKRTCGHLCAPLFLGVDGKFCVQFVHGSASKWNVC